MTPPPLRNFSENSSVLEEVGFPYLGPVKMYHLYFSSRIPSESSAQCLQQPTPTATGGQISMSKFKSNLEHNPLVKPLFFQICGDDAATKCESNGRPHVMLPSRPLLTREKPKLPPQQFGRCFICAASPLSKLQPTWFSCGCNKMHLRVELATRNKNFCPILSPFAPDQAFLFHHPTSLDVVYTERQ